MLNIIDGRDEIAAEMAAAPLELKQVVAAVFRQMLIHPDFANVLPGLISDPDRAGLVMQRIKALCQ